MVHDPIIDIPRDTLVTGLTFKQLRSIIDSGIDGDIADAMQLFIEMESFDPRLASVANTRRLALTGLDWEIVSAAKIQSSVQDKELADDVASHINEQFDKIEHLDCALEHLSTAIGPNLALLETIWESSRLVELSPVPYNRLTMDLRKSTDIRVITADERLGIEARSPQFVVHIPNGKTASPLFGSLMVAQAQIWLAKKLALADWGAFVELYGIPLRIGSYDDSTPTEAKDLLKKFLHNLGSAGWALKHRSTSIDIIESSQRGTSPHEAFVNSLNREQSILWLGGNLTSDTTGGTGTFAAAEVQDRVRADLRDDDIKREARTIREQIIQPMVRLAFPNRDVPVPYFRRVKPETVDRIKEAELIYKAQMASIEVPEAWARERTGIPKPVTDENGQREAVLDNFNVESEMATEGGFDPYESLGK